MTGSIVTNLRAPALDAMHSSDRENPPAIAVAVGYSSDRSPAQALTAASNDAPEMLVVDTLEDVVDGLDTNGISLREAIAAIAADGTIVFDNLLADGTIELALGPLNITQGLSIDAEENNISIDAGGNSSVLTINDGSDATTANIFLSGLTVTGGSAVSGGGILNFENLNLIESTASGNTAINGGGIFNEFLYGTLTVIDSTISNNSAIDNGGGIFSDSETSVAVIDSTIDGNTATGNGGAILSGADITINNSTIDNNSAGLNGGSIFNASLATLSLTNSTISGNTAAASGGAIYNTNSTLLSITNSTLAGNSAGVDGGGFYTSNNATAIVTNSTIANNTADDSGGGIDNNGGQITLASAIVADNTADGDNPDIANADLAINGTVSANFSLVEAGELTNDADDEEDNNIIDQDPLLDPNGLQNNGGPTQTIALQFDSPAIDAGSNPNNLATDQRGEGFDRVIDEGPDIGAFEGIVVDLNVDGVGDFDPFVDGLNIFRVAAGAPQAVVVTSAAAEAGITQQAIVDAVNNLNLTALNVDGVGDFDPFVDGLNIFRVAAGAPQAVVVTSAAAEAGMTQQAIVDAVGNLLP